MITSTIDGLYRSIVKGTYKGYKPVYDAIKPALQAHARNEDIGNFGRFVSIQENAELDIFAERLIEETRLREELRQQSNMRPSPKHAVYLVTKWDDASGMGVEIRTSMAPRLWRTDCYSMSVTYKGGNPDKTREDFLTLVEQRFAEAQANPYEFFSTME